MCSFEGDQDYWSTQMTCRWCRFNCSSYLCHHTNAVI